MYIHSARNCAYLSLNQVSFMFLFLKMSGINVCCNMKSTKLFKNQHICTCLCLSEGSTSIDELLQLDRIWVLLNIQFLFSWENLTHTFFVPLFPIINTQSKTSLLGSDVFINQIILSLNALLLLGVINQGSNMWRRWDWQVASWYWQQQNAPCWWN